jgi:hypothetical protein
MTSQAGTAAPEQRDLERRRGAALLPAVLASVLGGSLVGAHVLVVLAVHLLVDPAEGSPDVIYLQPSVAEQAAAWAWFLAGVAVSLGLLLLTWRLRGLGRTAATWVCAVAAVATPALLLF